jgi:hypothetical protein
MVSMKGPQVDSYSSEGNKGGLAKLSHDIHRNRLEIWANIGPVMAFWGSKCDWGHLNG